MSVSADPLNKTARASLLRFPLRSKANFDEINQHKIDEFARSNSPGTRSSRSPPRARQEQPAMIAPSPPPETNRKMQMSVMSGMSRIDQLSVPNNHRKIIELEAKLKVLQ